MQSSNRTRRRIKDRYNSKNLVKATTKLEKCYMKSDLDDPHLWIMEMEQLNREVEKMREWNKALGQTGGSDYLGEIAEKKYKSVIDSLNGKIGMKDFTHNDFVSEILGHYEMFVEPFKNCQARENLNGQEKERGRHLALNMLSGKEGWRAFEGKCNKCGKQGHRAQDCRTNINNNDIGERENAKKRVKCYNCGGFGHKNAKEYPKKLESGMFVGMTIHEAESREDDIMKNVNSTQDYFFDTDKLERELLQDIPDYNNMKRAVLKDIQDFKRKTRDRKLAQAKIRSEREESKTMSWANMCETSDNEDNKFEDKETSEEVAEDVTMYDKSKTREPEAEQMVIEDEKSNVDESKHKESKTRESDATKNVEDTEYSTTRHEELVYRMDKISRSMQCGRGTRKFLLQIREK